MPVTPGRLGRRDRAGGPGPRSIEVRGRPSTLSYGQSRRSLTTKVPRTRAAGWAAAASLVAGLVGMAPPASADHGSEAGHAGGRPPTIASVQSRLDALDRKAEIASESYNTVRVHVHQARSRLSTLQADLARQQSRAANLRQDLVTAALSH